MTSNKTEILNLHGNRRQIRGSRMSEVKKCPECGGSDAKFLKQDFKSIK